MTLTKIKLANKKAKRAATRKLKHERFVQVNRATKVRNRKMRKLFIEGRREDLRKRQVANQYVNQLQGELENES